MVVIKQSNNELRICLDPQDLNNNLKRTFLYDHSRRNYKEYV